MSAELAGITQVKCNIEKLKNNFNNIDNKLNNIKNGIFNYTVNKNLLFLSFDKNFKNSYFNEQTNYNGCYLSFSTGSEVKYPERITLLSTGSHTHNGSKNEHDDFKTYKYRSTDYINSGKTNSGSHTHSIIIPEDEDLLPPTIDCKLLKLNTDLIFIPKGAVYFYVEGFNEYKLENSGIIRFNSDSAGDYNEYTNSFNNKKTDITITSSSNGSHSHRQPTYIYDWDDDKYTVKTASNEGDHTHDLTFDIEVNYVYTKLKMTISDNDFLSPGAICLCDGSIPKGWVLCDGNNDTPNLLNKFALVGNNDDDYYIQIGDFINSDDNIIDTKITNISCTDSGSSDHNHTLSDYDRVSDNDSDDNALVDLIWYTDYDTVDYSHSHTTDDEFSSVKKLFLKPIMFKG